MTWAVHISLAPTWFDPAETPGIATPFMILYGVRRFSAPYEDVALEGK
jgi:hypothetical protein